MNDKDSVQHGGMNLGDIYFVLFRHKWLIILSSLAGISAAAILLFAVKPPKYRSQTKLLIKYVTEIKSPVQRGDDESTKSLDDRPHSLINTEVLILTSLDLGRDVVSSIGAEKILAKAGGGTDPDKAAAMVVKGLEIEQISGGNVLVISFEHPDPNVVQDVLKQVIVSYYKKHNEMHQPVQISDFLSKETERLRGRLTQIDEELQKAKSKAGVISADVTQKGYAEHISQIREKIDNAETELAEHQTTLNLLTQSPHFASETTNTPGEIPLKLVNDYKGICARLNILSKREQELLTQFTEESTRVQEVRRQMAETELEKKKLEQQYPYLAYAGIASPEATGSQTATNTVSPSVESARIITLQSKIEILKSQLSRVWAEATNLDSMMTTITELQKKKELAENDLKYYSASLERSRIEATMGNQTAPNISMIESPTPPKKNWSKQFKKKVSMVAAGGIFGGVALAFLIELMLDNSVKRPGDIEAKLRLPLLISIPDTSRNGQRKNPLRLKGEGSNNLAVVGQASLESTGWNQTNSLSRFYTGLRDRLLVYFEVRNVTHKPKLVAVTSCHQGAGVTSIAAGLAASLSETGDGNVLLVDMNPEQQVVQQFHKGKLACGLAGALEPETKANALVQEKLYVVTERVDSEKQFRNLPKRFSELVPKLKASDYDYIIFDMPPVTQTSVTPRLAGLMDMVLLVIESEKTNRDVVKKVNALLAESKANVSTVLNKTRTYVPVQLHQEYLSDI
ncbi:MAG: Wzz/FepE/Etk N-terminal domain-containing protein [Verrucomicrobiales bacterium]|nr:Wzz/FepE/Etk N-terminal domain-containing protein [Verrucomicrobiales bacterium]